MKLRWLWLTLIIVGLVPAAYLMRDFVSFYVITPVVFAYRIERLLVNAFPQVVFWSLFLLASLLLALRTLPLKINQSKKKSETGEKYHSRARQFSKWILNSEKSEYARWMAARQLSTLAFDLLMYQERLSPAEATVFIKKHQLNIPERVRGYILAGLEAPSFRHYSELLENYRINSLDSPFETPPEAVIKFLESRLDNGGPD